MSQPKNPPLISGTQFVAIVALTVAIILIIDFGRRATAGYYVTQAEKRLEAEIAALEKEQEELKARLEEIETDEFVEKWAREEALLAHPGDQPLILVVDAAVRAPTETVRGSSAAATQDPNWHEWWNLFFEGKPDMLWAQ
jgi:cell division protein FtsB